MCVCMHTCVHMCVVCICVLSVYMCVGCMRAHVSVHTRVLTVHCARVCVRVVCTCTCAHMCVECVHRECAHMCVAGGGGLLVRVSIFLPCRSSSS